MLELWDAQEQRQIFGIEEGYRTQIKDIKNSTVK